MLNALTIDVEDYYHVSAFESIVRKEDWPKFESRVERNTIGVLNILSDFNVKATFFILGWVAERFPQMVRDIQKEGHEIACHGYWHKLIYQRSRDFFRDDIRKAKAILEETAGTKVTGYRAPSYSIIQDTIWALDILIEEGFEYDSSIFPIRHDRYGMPDSERFPYIISRDGYGEIKEFPLSTIRFLGVNFPVAGGGYFRLFPYRFTRWALNRINKVERKPFIFYFHPWEIDPDQPRLKPGYVSRFRHYVNLSKTDGKLRKLLGDFKFTPVKNVLASVTSYEVAFKM
jgi:polysaccharide deactylase family protein, PEP-CTERM locus subfamily